MDNLIHLIKDKNNDCNLSEKIKIIKYTENENKREKISNYNNIVFCILDNYDHILSNTEQKEKYLVFKQRVSEISSQIEENKEKYYNKMKYNERTMSCKKIQQQLQISSQQKKCFYSAINYLSDLYNKHFVFIDKSKNEFYKTNEKNYEKVYIIYDDNKYQLHESYNKEYNEGEQNKCPFLEMDIKTVYVSHLMPMSKYKIDELQNLAKEIDISIKLNGKTKLKKVLYDEINSHYLHL